MVGAIVLVLMVLCGNTLSFTNAPRAAVTYKLNNGGRLGNQFLCYMHAKWVAYHFDIPLLYVPFSYSDQLVMHDIEQHFVQREVGRRFNRVVTLQRGGILTIDRDSPTLYVIPYFPECVFEVESFNSSACYFKVPWDDAGFKEELQKCIRPKRQLSLLQKLSDGIAVGVHVRKSCNGIDGNLSHDFPQGLNTPNMVFMDASFPFSFVPDGYYLEQITRLTYLFPRQKLYVYIISDDSNVDKIIQKYRQIITSPQVEFICRAAGNGHDSNVLEDFFFLAQCDCLIRSESTFAATASKLGDYLVHTFPKHHRWDNGHLVMDEVEMTMRGNPIRTHFMWLWPHQSSWCKCKQP
jgi:hypothetical protein